MPLIKRFFLAPQGSFFLFGPRGTGKSTWLKDHFPDALLIDLLDSEQVRRYSAYPERLAEVVRAHSSQQIIIDEIQHVPALLTVVHQLIEEKKTWQFILTGSSARKLKRGGVDLLAGRAIMCHMHPFMASELGDAFNLEDALEKGLLPVVLYGTSPPADVLKTYIGLYLKEEVQTEGLVRNIGHFSQFLEVASFSHASLLNVTNIAREAGISRASIEGYLSVLKDLLLCFTVPVFTKRAKRETVNHVKFYYFDAGVFRFLRKQGPLDRSEELTGLALEGLVAQHLRAWNDYQGTPYDLYYWRTRFGVEVDFILYGPKGFWAIEVKNDRQVFSKDLSGLRAFCDDYPEATPLLLYRGKERLKKNNILCLPVFDFLKQLRPSDDFLSQ